MFDSKLTHVGIKLSTKSRMLLPHYLHRLDRCFQVGKKTESQMQGSEASASD